MKWKRRVEAGELQGPTIYTSGMFINEPRVTTPEDVRLEVLDQARQGYDLIKFHELDETTTGLSLPAYRTMIETAREARACPLVGHAPVNLGLDVMLEAHQAVAHVGALSNIYFLPIASNLRVLALTAAAVVVPMAIAAGWGVAAIQGGKRATGIDNLRIPVTHSDAHRVGDTGHRSRGVCVAMVMPGAPLFESSFLRVLLTADAVFIAAATVLLVIFTARIVRDASRADLRVRPGIGRVDRKRGARTGADDVLGAGLVAQHRQRRSIGWPGASTMPGISVQSTLVVYESLKGKGTTI